MYTEGSPSSKPCLWQACRNPVQPNCMHPPHQGNVVIQASKAGCVGARQLIARWHFHSLAVHELSHDLKTNVGRRTCNKAVNCLETMGIKRNTTAPLTIRCSNTCNMSLPHLVVKQTHAPDAHARPWRLQSHCRGRQQTRGKSGRGPPGWERLKGGGSLNATKSEDGQQDSCKASRTQKAQAGAAHQG